MFMAIRDLYRIGAVECHAMPAFTQKEVYTRQSLAMSCSPFEYIHLEQ